MGLNEIWGKIKETIITKTSVGTNKRTFESIVKREKKVRILFCDWQTFFAWLTDILLEIVRIVQCHILCPQCDLVCTASSGTCPNSHICIFGKYFYLIKLQSNACSGRAVDKMSLRPNITDVCNKGWPKSCKKYHYILEENYIFLSNCMGNADVYVSHKVFAHKHLDAQCNIKIFFFYIIVINDRKNPIYFHSGPWLKVE